MIQPNHNQTSIAFAKAKNSRPHFMPVHPQPVEARALDEAKNLSDRRRMPQVYIVKGFTI
jgi:hypothetical protein